MTALTFVQAVAITLLFVWGSIFDFLRKGDSWKDKLLKCPLCFGFWVGWFVYGVPLMAQPVGFVQAIDVRLPSAFAWGASVGVAAYSFHWVIELLSEYAIAKTRENKAASDGD